jgi:hypothetical protein
MQLEHKLEATVMIVVWIQVATMTNKVNLEIIKEELHSSFNLQIIFQTYHLQIKQE